MSTLSIWLPFPPSVNNLFSQGVVNGKVRRFRSKRYTQWRSAAVGLICTTRFPKITGPVAVRIALTPPSGARRDVDNYVKPVLDAFVTAHVLADDRQVERVTAVWDRGAMQPGAVVEIEELKIAKAA